MKDDDRREKGVLKGFFGDFLGRAADEKIPLSGSFDLTKGCNLRCVHCYVSGPGVKSSLDAELSTNQWLSITDQITEAGCLNLLLTGGEPLIRQDFEVIYRRARNNGLLVTIFTNGTLLDERILDLFVELPPQVVEISIYGATAETFDKVTGVEGSYGRCLAGVKALLERKIELKLKTVLLEKNSHEFPAMEKMAGELGVSFRLDAAVFPCLDGNPSPTTLRIPAKKAVALEFSDPVREKNWREYFERTRDLPVEDTLYTCGAGITSWHVDSHGRLLPCLLLTSPAYDLKEGAFNQGWEEIIIPFRQKKAEDDYPCNRCEKRALCGFCPALFELEEGSPGHPAEYICRLGEERFLRLTDGLYKG